MSWSRGSSAACTIRFCAEIRERKAKKGTNEIVKIAGAVDRDKGLDGEGKEGVKKRKRRGRSKRGRQMTKKGREKRGGSMIDGYWPIENRAGCLPARLNFTFKFAWRKVCVLGFVCAIVSFPVHFLRLCNNVSGPREQPKINILTRSACLGRCSPNRLIHETR